MRRTDLHRNMLFRILEGVQVVGILLLIVILIVVDRLLHEPIIV